MIEIKDPTTLGRANCSCTLLRQAFNDDNQQENIIITARHCIRQGNFGNGPLADIANAKLFFNNSNPDCNTTPNVQNKAFRYELTGGMTLIDESSIHDIAEVVLFP